MKTITGGFEMMLKVVLNLMILIVMVEVVMMVHDVAFFGRLNVNLG